MYKVVLVRVRGRVLVLLVPAPAPAPGRAPVPVPVPVLVVTVVVVAAVVVVVAAGVVVVAVAAAAPASEASAVRVVAFTVLRAASIRCDYHCVFRGLLRVLEGSQGFRTAIILHVWSRKHGTNGYMYMKTRRRTDNLMAATA